MVTPPVQTCRMPFLNQWNRNNRFFGLQFGSNDVSLNRSCFSCCSGDGLQIVSRETKDAKLCGLLIRWHLVSSILRLYNLATIRSGSQSFELLMTGLQNASKDENLEKSSVDFLIDTYFPAFKTSAKGEFLDIEKIPALRSMNQETIWVASVALGWHFETLLLVFRLSSKDVPILEWQDMIRRNAHLPKVIVIEGECQMWNPKTLLAFEHIISFASERLIPLWVISYPLNSSPNQDKNDVESDLAVENNRTFKSKINKRLRTIAAKPWFQWLSVESQSKLQEICNISTEERKPRKMPEHV